MATHMGFPPGARIQLRDNSAFSVVENPYTTAGVVGYASKGELNKIIQVNDTGELGTKLGFGYQQAKYNQGMYAARAVLDAGGVVEFVRPYGEEISKTDPFKRDLKTDTFVVAYDKSGLAESSIGIEYFASTRYKTDDAAAYGATRKINNIAETVATGSNVDFNLSSSETFVESKKHRTPVDMVLFALMNRDPSNAYRAFDRYEMTSDWNGTTRTLTCKFAATPGFLVGEEVFIPICDGNDATAVAVVTSIDGKDVTLTVDGDRPENADFALKGKPQPTVVIYCNEDTAVTDGYDYLNVRTAVAGNTVKTLNAIKWKIQDDYVDGETIPCGTPVKLYDKNRQEYEVRFFTKPAVVKNVNVTVDGSVTSLSTTSELVIEQGDTIVLSNLSNTYVAVVDTVTADSIELTTPAGLTSGTYDLTISSLCEDDLVANVVGATNLSQVVDAFVETLTTNGLGYNKNPIANDIVSVDADAKTVTLDVNGSFDYSVGDQVAIVRGKNAYKYADKAKMDADAILWFGEVSDVNTRTGVITLSAAKPFPQLDVDSETNKLSTVYQLLNLKTSAFSVYDAVSSAGGDTEKIEVSTPTVESTVTGGNIKVTSITGINDLFAEDDHLVDPVVGSVLTLTASVVFDGSSDPEEVEIPVNIVEISKSTTSDPATYTLTVKGEYTSEAAINSVTFTKVSFETVYETEYEVYTYFVSSYSMYLSKSQQSESPVESVKVGTDVIAEVVDADAKDTKTTTIVEKSPKVLAESDIGATFLSLGLAKTDYIDIDYTGEPRQVYVLTEDGENIARMFLAITYRYNGTTYEFDGTIVPYLYNGIQLDIRDAAEYELTNSGIEFVVNDSGILDYFLENISYDLSQTAYKGILNGSTTQIAYNQNDPAIINDAVWTYNPLNNNSGSTLSTVWNLFINKDGSDVDMLVSAGMNLNHPFMKNIETLNTQVMQAMLNVCEARKDCFALFDSPAEARIEVALKKEIVATGFGSTHGRWGMLYDGRGVFFDSIYTHSNVDIMKSVQVASIITSNRQSGIYWLPPSGYDYAPIPSAWGTKEKYFRTYNAEDKNCDVAKLTNIHANATRSNKEGLFIWGDFTLQMENTAFNQAHVTMLVAGIHKSFYKYLDHKVFRLNTTNLRAQITSDLQGRLNSIMTANPQGLINGKVICDDSNNTADLIDQNFLIVDLKLLPPKSARWIILRTEVESTKNGNKISTTLIA